MIFIFILLLCKLTKKLFFIKFNILFLFEINKLITFKNIQI